MQQYFCFLAQVRHTHTDTGVFCWTHIISQYIILFWANVEGFMGYETVNTFGIMIYNIFAFPLMSVFNYNI